MGATDIKRLILFCLFWFIYYAYLIKLTQKMSPALLIDMAQELKLTIKGADSELKPQAQEVRQFQIYHHNQLSTNDGS